MATEPDITGAPTRAPTRPGLADSNRVNAAMNRRALMAGAGIAAAAVSLPAMASAVVAGHVPAQWSALVAVYDARVAEGRAAYNAYDRLDEHAKTLMPPAPIEPKLIGEVTRDMTIAEIRAMPFDRDWSTYEVEKKAWEHRCHSLRREITGAAADEDAAAAERLCEAIEAIKDYEVPTFALLIAKLDLLQAEYGGEEECGFAACIFADVRRLAVLS